jgi:uncharacterized damage-inducible protein DinB
MTIDDIRYLLAYDRWATSKILDAAAGIDDATWAAENAIDRRGLGGILVHQLGATQRWRNGLAGTGVTPRPEREPLITVDELRARWAHEWDAWESWVAIIDDAWLAQLEGGVPRWQMLVHVANHGTQHRSEAATLLTAVDRSPGDLDMIFFAEELARG